MIRLFNELRIIFLNSALALASLKDKHENTSSLFFDLLLTLSEIFPQLREKSNDILTTMSTTYKHIDRLQSYTGRDTLKSIITNDKENNLVRAYCAQALDKALNPSDSSVFTTVLSNPNNTYEGDMHEEYITLFRTLVPILSERFKSDPSKIGSTLANIAKNNNIKFEIRRLCIESMGRINWNNTDAVKALSDILASPVLQNSAIKSKRTLMHMEASEEVYLRKYAARALRKIDKENNYKNIADSLIRIIERHNEVFVIRLFAVKELSRLFKPDINKTTGLKTKSSAFEKMDADQKDKISKILNNVANNKIKNVVMNLRIEAIYGIAYLEDERSYNTIYNMINSDENYLYRKAALVSASNIKETDELKKSLFNIANNPKEFTEVRITAIHSLTRFRDKEIY